MFQWMAPAAPVPAVSTDTAYQTRMHDVHNLPPMTTNYDLETEKEILRLQEVIDFTNETIMEHEENQVKIRKAHNQRMQDLVREGRTRKMKVTKGENQNMLAELLEQEESRTPQKAFAETTSFSPNKLTPDILQKVEVFLGRSVAEVLRTTGEVGVYAAVSRKVEWQKKLLARNITLSQNASKLLDAAKNGTYDSKNDLDSQVAFRTDDGTSLDTTSLDTRQEMFKKLIEDYEGVFEDLRQQGSENGI